MLFKKLKGTFKRSNIYQCLSVFSIHDLKTLDTITVNVPELLR